MDPERAIQVIHVVVFDWLDDVLVCDPTCKFPPHADYQIIKINRPTVICLTSGAGSKLGHPLFREMSRARWDTTQTRRAQTPIIRLVGPVWSISPWNY